jgi:hypothetical protein
LILPPPPPITKAIKKLLFRTEDFSRKWTYCGFLNFSLILCLDIFYWLWKPYFYRKAFELRRPMYIMIAVVLQREPSGNSCNSFNLVRTWYVIIP